MNLNNEHLKQDPYSVSQSYIDSVEERVRASIRAKEKETPKIFLWLKPAFMLASMFLLIGSLGYIASNITDKYAEAHSENDDILALIEEGYLKSSFIDSYYDELDIRDSFDQPSDNEIDSEKINTLFESSNLTPEELLYYIELENRD